MKRDWSKAKRPEQLRYIRWLCNKIERCTVVLEQRLETDLEHSIAEAEEYLDKLVKELKRNI